MTELELLFAQYKKNMDKMDMLRNKSFAFPDEENWKVWYKQIKRKMDEIYQENDGILKRLNSIVSVSLPQDMVDLLYEQAMKMYREGYDDGQLLITIFKVLESIYENDPDNDHMEKLIPMYLAHSYEMNIVMYRQASVDFIDTGMLEKVLALFSVYESLSEKIRVCFWKAVFNYVVVGMHHGNLTVKESFSLFRYYRDFWESDQVRELEKDNLEVQDIINNIYHTFAYITLRIDEMEDENIPDFIEILDEIYEREIDTVSNELDLDGSVYAGHLYSLYLKGKENIDAIFEKFWTFYQYTAKEIYDEGVMDEEKMDIFLGCTKILYCFAKRGINPEKKNLLMGMFRALSESKWSVESNAVIQKVMNMTYLLCNIIIEFSDKEMDIENFYYQMLVRKNIVLYIHAKHVSELAQIVFEKAYSKKPELFASFKDMSYEKLYSFVGQCGLFHDIGSISTIFLAYYRSRPLTPEEIELINLHPLISMEMVEKSHEMDRYKDVMSGHHKSYDGKTGYPKSVDVSKSSYKIIVDLIHIVDYIDLNCDEFLVYHPLSGEKLLEELSKGKHTEFHPDLVDVILEDRMLFNKILKKMELSYDSLKEYHENIEEFAVYQTPEEFVAKLEEKMNEAFAEHREDDFMKHVNRLFAMSVKENSHRLMGIAYYYSMRIHLHKGENIEAMNAGSEAVRYLEDTEEYHMITITYNILGAIMQIVGNKENGLHYFLQSIEKAKFSENPNEDLVYPYNNVANLMKNVGQVDRALYYYSLAEKLDIQDDMFKLGMYCNILYCYILINNDEKIAEYYELIKAYKEKGDYPVFLVMIYTACLHAYHGDIENMVAAIKEAVTDTSYLLDYSFYMDEIHICLDLLERYEKYDLLMELMNQYLAYFDQDMVSFQEYQHFLQQKARCEKKCGDQESLLKTLSDLEENMERENSVVAEQIMDLEKSYAEMMQMQVNQRHLQKDKERLEKEVLLAREANQAKSTFLSEMSHEIRTPIHAILGLDEMILRESKNETILDYARDIKNAGKTLMGIINDVLDFSKMESGQLEISLVKYDTKSMILDLKNMILPRANEKKLEFLIRCDESLPSTLYGDELRIKQIILNILTNAVKYTAEGKITFDIGFCDVSDSKIDLCVTITDTGMGMKEEDLEKLFKPFERIEEKKNKNIEGTGLGMSIVFSLIKQMDGTIDVKSEYTKGSQFKVSIPQGVVDRKCVGDIFKRRMGTHTNNKELFTAPDAKILVVDDNAVNIKVVLSLLKRNQVQTFTAFSGFECLDMARTDKYDLILLDHRMPEMDGVETLKRLKEECILNQETPVIALTANAISGAYDYYMSVGFHDLLTKPVNVNELETKIMKYLPKERIVVTD